MKILLFFHVISALLLCCSTNKSREKFNAERVVISSVGVNTPKGKYEVSDTNFVNGIVRELSEMIPYVPDSGRSKFPTKANHGFFEVEVFYQDIRKVVFKVVYTSYYGVIISMDNKYYKNDELEYKIIAAISEQK